MNGKRALLGSLMLVAAVSWGGAGAGQPAAAQQPWDGVAAPRSLNHSGTREHWDEHFQGRGNVTETRCLGMNRGPSCITPAIRKEAARRALEARKAAEAGAAEAGAAAPGSAGNNRGGKGR